MGLSNLSFSATNINAGAYADRPAQCKEGDIYVCTDGDGITTPYLLVCLSENIWSNPAPAITCVTSDYSRLKPLYSVSDDVIYLDSTSVNCYTKDLWYTTHEFIVPVDMLMDDGNIRLKWTIINGNGTDTDYFYVKVVVNDTVESALLNMGAADPFTVSYDTETDLGLTLQPGDKISIMGRQTFATSDSTPHSVQDVKMCGVFNSPIATPTVTPV
jgi:hypothetical protein